MIRRSKEDWLLLFARQADSGLSIKRFCSQNSISLSAFYSARNRYGLSKDDLSFSESEHSAPAENNEADSVSAPSNHSSSLSLQDEPLCSEPYPSFTSIRVKPDNSVFIKERQSRDSTAADINNEEPLQFLCGRVPITVSPSMSANNLAVLIKACLMA